MLSRLLLTVCYCLKLEKMLVGFRGAVSLQWVYAAVNAVTTALFMHSMCINE